MKAVIQRVDRAELSVDGNCIAQIGRGLVVYVGVEQGDDEMSASAFCQKLVCMRIFSDDNCKLNLSVSDIRGDILLVSNFTLCADISHGHRPSFSGAMRPPLEAKKMFDFCVDTVRDLMSSVGCADNVKCGVFGADMIVDQANSGPVTIIY